MAKREIVQKIAEEIGLTRLQTKQIVQKTFDSIVNTLVAEGRVEPVRCRSAGPGSIVRPILATLLLGLLAGLFIAEGSALADEAVWTVRMVQKKQENRLSVENRVLFIDLLQQHAWTIRNIRYRGDEIVGEHGANGSVVNAKPEADAVKKDPWIGTGHGKEKVRRLTILVNGKERPYQSGGTFSGQVVVIHKVSNLGPLDHEAEITFPSSGDRIIERHAYKVVEDLGRRFNFVYAFMHCNNNSLDQWLALTAGGKELEGRVGKGDGQFSLKEDARTVIFYSATMKKGVVYAYPEVYEGEPGFKNAIWDRKGDNKLYFRPAVGKKYRMGDGFEFHLQVIPFSAEPDDWKGKAKRLAE